MALLRRLLSGRPPPRPTLLEATVYFTDDAELHTVVQLREGTQDYVLSLPGRSLAELFYVALNLPDGAELYVETEG